MSIEIDNDNGEIRVDGYEYATKKVKVKDYYISSENSQIGNAADLRLTDSDGYTDNVTIVGGTNVTIVRNDANTITVSASANDTNTTYGISAETNVAPKSADLRLTGSDTSTDNVTLVGGTNVTITRTDANTITFSATDIDTNTKYSISSETSQTGNSADIRLTDSDGYTDNVTITGGSNVTITKNSSSQFTIDSYNSDTTYSIEASSSTVPLGAKISLKDSNNLLDNVYVVQGTGVSVSYTGAPDAITIGNTGVTQINQGTGITVSGQTGNVTVTNDGVTKFNGAKGSVDYYSFSQMTDGYNTAVADSPNDTFRFNAGSGITVLVDQNGDSITIGNDGVRTFNGTKGSIVFNAFGSVTDGYNTAVADAPNDALNVAAGAGISVAIDGYTDSLTISNTGVRQNIGGTGISVSSATGNVTINNTGVTQFNGASGNISYNSFGTIFDGYNTATADQANDTITFIPGSGIGVLVNAPGDSLTISNTGVTQAVAGAGISVSAGTGNVTIGNTGVIAITAGTGITTSGSGNVTINNNGVTSLNGGTGAQYQYSIISDGGVGLTTPSSGHTTLSVLGTNGIKSTVTPDTVTLSMSETSKILSSDISINPTITAPIFIVNNVPANPLAGSAFEFRSVIMIKFAAASVNNTIDLLLATNGSFTNAAADVFIGPVTIGEITSGSTSITSSGINDTKIHVVTISGIVHNGGTTANISISMKNNAASALTVITKSFMKYNVI